MSLKAGASSIDISPGKPMFLVGYPHVERISEGVNDPLLANAVYLENQGTRILMISVDLLFLDAAAVAEIRRMIAARGVIREQDIMISCTHTHSGPHTVDVLSFRNDPVVPEVDMEYLGLVKKRIAECAASAIGNARPAELAVSSVDVEGVGGNRHSQDGIRDPEVGIILVRGAEDKEIISISLTYCMHPTVLHEDSKLVSADFPGYAREFLKRKFGKDIVVAYHTGPEGNQSPRYHVRGQTFAEAERLGNRLGAFILQKIETVGEDLFSRNPVVASASECIAPSRKTMPSVADAERNLASRRSEFERLKREKAGHGPVRTAECSVFGAEETLYLAKCASDGSLDRILAGYAKVEVQVFRIGDVFIAGFPGELFVEYSIELKRRSQARVFAICLANGEMQGYITTSDASGYEADNSLFLPVTGEKMLESALGMIENLNKK